MGRKKCVQLKKLLCNIQAVPAIMSESACYKTRSSTPSSQVFPTVPFYFYCKMFKICHE